MNMSYTRQNLTQTVKVNEAEMSITRKGANYEVGRSPEHLLMVTTNYEEAMMMVADCVSAVLPTQAQRLTIRRQIVAVLLAA